MRAISKMLTIPESPRSIALNWALTIAALIFGAGNWAANAVSDTRHIEKNIEELKDKQKDSDARRDEMDRKRDEKLTDIQIKVGILISREADKANQH
jgi:hypothetical protein